MDKVWTIVRSVLLSALAVAVIIFSVYLFNSLEYYKAGEAAAQNLEYDNVVVIDNGASRILFDGPGTDKALIFFQGFQIEATAYAPIMHELAASGVDCIVLKMPLREAHLLEGAATYTLQNFDYETWYIAGHGSGALAASEWASKNADKIAGIIMLGGYPEKDITEVSRAAIILGTLDSITDQTAMSEAMGYLPASAQVLGIEGGNYSQFADIELMELDTPATITPEEQWKQTVSLILSVIEK